MALTAAQYTAMFSTSNSDADYLTSDEISEIENDFNSNEYLTDKDKLLQFGPMIQQLYLQHRQMLLQLIQLRLHFLD